MRPALFVALLAVPVTSAPVLHAQTLREYSSTRQDHGESHLAATIQYAGGDLSLVPAPAGILYTLRLTYDAERFAPVAQFDPAVPRLTLGTEPLSRTGGVRVSNRGTPPAATVGLGTRVDPACRAYVGHVLAMPEMIAWIAAAKREREEIDELDMEF